MPLDSYSYCPGGRDKKIRFCCSNMLKELQTIETMIESEQFAACLSFIEQEEKKHPDCACLTAAKCTVLRSISRWEDAYELAAKFAQKEPYNPLAQTEYAVCTAYLKDGNCALPLIVKAMEASDPGSIHQSLFFGIYFVTIRLLSDREIIPAIALAKQLRSYAPESQESQDLFQRIFGDKSISVLLKELTVDQKASEQYSQKEKYSEAVAFLTAGHWDLALKMLESMVSTEHEWVNLWKNIAIVQLWLGKKAEALVSFEKYIELISAEIMDACDGQIEKAVLSPAFEDAVDIESVLTQLKNNPLNDDAESYLLTMEIDDPDAVAERLLSSPHFQAAVIPTHTEDGNPPPQNAFYFYDRPVAPRDERPTFENTPRRLAVVLLYGRQTDKKAQLQAVQVLSFEKEQVLSEFESLLGNLISGQWEQKTLDVFSRTSADLVPRFGFSPSNSPTQEEILQISQQYYTQEFTSEFLNRSYPFLDGKSISDVVRENCSLPLLIRSAGAIYWIEGFLPSIIADPLIDVLRDKLHLPSPTPIVFEEEINAENFAQTFYNIPAWRWFRLETDKLSTPVIAHLFQIIQMLGETRGERKLATVLLDRPLKDVPFEIRREAFHVLVNASLEENDEKGAFLWIEKAKSESEEMHVSDGLWNIAELSLFMKNSAFEKAQECISHVMMEHRAEEDVIQALQTMFIQFGILNPDGSPRTPQGPMSGGTQNGQRVTDLGTVGGNGGNSSSGLWTPDSDNDETSGGGSKLWMPD